ncbi:alpha/beta hydrolase [Planktothrix sp. FACHB-1355]|uniref:Alpha/beta hydrolase n=1 Tax=Aerosakkonema funiforme FACHB-1375 TaxID=2949571 RepID=A0A926VHW4_9CYAN|nr:MULTISPECIES: alpha/beta hydrolase [Oscillatoriales]MBD2184201.1 alpha/beta hydrolase [Aerosakkonema funiforme FACHB-1375]MBD3563011.1 alpha/beta hydrolase [Planktothrix sp. FACHB-1355]
MQTVDLEKLPTQFYNWKNYRCAYEVYNQNNNDSISLLLIHPIGVGLSGNFWQRFCRQWYAAGHRNPIYNPDLLGCGESDMPRVAYHPIDWAKQLQYFLHNVVKKPVILVVQGALFPVAVELVQLEKKSNLIRGAIFSGPPAWRLISNNTPDWKHKVNWNIFDSPVGRGFFEYARSRKFIRNFSIRQLFAEVEKVDDEWLDMLTNSAKDAASRHAVFAFLAGFWRQDYKDAIAQISQPTLVVMGEEASSISKEGKKETPDERLADYLACLPKGRGLKMRGRNVLPYEETTEFVNAIAPFIREIA